MYSDSDNSNSDSEEFPSPDEYKCTNCRKVWKAEDLEIDDTSGDEAFYQETMGLSLFGLGYPHVEEYGEIVFETSIPCPKCNDDLDVKVSAEVHFTVSETYEVHEIQESTYYVVGADEPIQGLLTKTEEFEKEDALWNTLKLEEYEEEAARWEEEQREKIESKQKEELEEKLKKESELKIIEAQRREQEERLQQEEQQRLDLQQKLILEEKQRQELKLRQELLEIEQQRKKEEMRIKNVQEKSNLVGQYFTGINVALSDHPKTKVIQAIATAQKNIELLMYTFSDKEIARALVERAKQNVCVRIIVDKHQKTTARGMIANLDFMNHNKILICARHGETKQMLNGSVTGSMHHKAMIIDNELVVKGSYNYTWSAQNLNDEDLSISVSSKLAKTWIKRFNEFWNTLQNN